MNQMVALFLLPFEMSVRFTSRNKRWLTEQGRRSVSRWLVFLSFFPHFRIFFLFVSINFGGFSHQKRGFQKTRPAQNVEALAFLVLLKKRICPCEVFVSADPSNYRRKAHCGRDGGEQMNVQRLQCQMSWFKDSKAFLFVTRQRCTAVKCWCGRRRHDCALRRIKKKKVLKRGKLAS